MNEKQLLKSQTCRYLFRQFRLFFFWENAQREVVKRCQSVNLNMNLHENDGKARWEQAVKCFNEISTFFLHRKQIEMTMNKAIVSSRIHWKINFASDFSAFYSRFVSLWLLMNRVTFLTNRKRRKQTRVMYSERRVLSTFDNKFFMFFIFVQINCEVCAGKCFEYLRPGEEGDEGKEVLIAVF